MFYGRGNGGNDFGRGAPTRRNDRYEQMTKQQELIEQKKREIQARIEAERKRKEMEVLVGKNLAPGNATSGGSGLSLPSSSSNMQRTDAFAKEETKSEAPSLKFANDGSFLEQFRRMQEEKKRKEEEEKLKKTTIKEEPLEDSGNEYGGSGGKHTKPLIKLINPDARVSSPSASADQIKQEPGSTMGNVPPPQFYDQKPIIPSSDRDRRYNDYDMGSFRSGGYQNAPPPPPPPPPPRKADPNQGPGGFPSQVVRRLAQQVAELGDHVEEITRTENRNDPLLWFLQRPDSNEYRKYRDLVAEYAEGFRMKEANEYGGASSGGIQVKVEVNEYGSAPMASVQPKRRNSSSSDEADTEEQRAARRRKRRSRWGPGEGNQPPGLGSNSSSPPPDFGNQVPLGVPPPPPPPTAVPFSQGFPPTMVTGVPPPSAALGSSAPGTSWGPSSYEDRKPPTILGNFPLMTSMEFDIKPTKTPGALTKVTRTNPQLIAYAQQTYGSTNLDEDQWKQCEEAYKMNLIFQDIARKKARDQKLEMAGKFKHEYDSDEETEGGTWEHKQRMKEMEKTKEWATDLTSKAKGKHHIGDFLPPEELAKFMEKYKAVKEGRQLDASDYQEFKITESNLGFKMLQKMGWTEGQGLGSTGQGITTPVEKGHAVSDKQGLGQEKPDDLTEEDDEYSAYRKRMMLAYRFRPNPLNNPRRAYY